MKNKLVLAIAAICGVGLMLTHFVLIGALIFAISTWKLLRLYDGERNWEAVQSALSDYEEIVSGSLWIGKQAEVLACDRVDNPRDSGPVRFEQICRTGNGQWFLFHVAVLHGRVLERNLTPLDKDHARLRLEGHKDVYVRYFGEPSVA